MQVTSPDGRLSCQRQKNRTPKLFMNGDKTEIMQYTHESEH